MNLNTVLIKPLVSEKSFNGAQNLNEYTFLVAKDATKLQVRVAIENAFGVKVVAIKTVTTKEKTRKRGRFTVLKKAQYKKAIVKLKPGDVIEVFEVEKKDPVKTKKQTKTIKKQNKEIK